MAMTAQEYLDTFNTLINQGNYDDAARLVKEADLAGYGENAYRAAAVALGAKANLPGGSDFIQPEGIQSIRDYVNTVTAPPPAPVDPNVEKFNSLIRTGDPANWQKAGELVTEAGFTPEQVLPYLNDPNIFPEFGGGVTLDTVQSFVPEDKGIATVLPPPVDTGSGTPPVDTGSGTPPVDTGSGTPPVDTGSGTPPVDTGSGTGLGASEEFTNAVRGGYYYIAAQIAQNLGYNVQQTAEYINANAAALGLPENFAGVTGENLQSFFDGVNAKRINAGMDEVNYPYFDDPDADPGKKQITVTDEDGNILSGPPDKVMPGIPKFARQTQSDLTFAPLRRGLAQLRTETYSPGLTSGQRALVGSGFTPEQLRQLTTKIAQEGEAAGKTQEQIVAEVEHLADIGGVSPAEAANVLGQSTKVMQDTYNQRRPGGIFATSAPTAPKPFALPQDFALQTGAYGAPTPTFFALPEKKTATSAAETPLPSGSTQNTDTGSEYTATDREGGLIKMAEGGGPPKMAELSAKEAGSTFDISKYIDDEGRLVGGYSKPLYEDNVLVDYEFVPYKDMSNVVFGEELRGKEAAMRLTDAERKQMMVEMAMRQGRTGIDPRVGGLAGIEIGDPMMRRRPQYYSTVEQFRPRYAEGGLANVAQNLAERGRKGDSMLVHMAPEEVAGLRALARAQGTDMTINPRTGLPEAFSLRKLFKAASFILPFVPIPGLFGMSSLLTKSIFSGIAAGASAKGGFDFKQALGGGLRAYALGSLGEKMGGAPTPDGAPTAPTTTSVPNAAAVDAAAVTAPTVTVPGVDGDISLAGSYTGPGSTPLGPQSLNANLTAPLKVGSSYGFQAATDVASAPIFEAPIGTAGGRDIPLTGGALPPGADTVPGRMANVVTPEGEGFGKPITKGFDIAAAGLGGFSLEKAAEETRRAEIEAAAVKQKEEERERLFEELARRTLGRVAVKSGGQINLAKGGMTYMEGGGTTDVTGEPRMVQGTGDGMSDSVPATIEGVQEARLANDEFVIPADVVADIGNGSSNAGAKKLYSMMDRIRKARHGTTKQPPEIRAERLMPA
jgi:hypothetical protein